MSLPAADEKEIRASSIAYNNISSLQIHPDYSNPKPRISYRQCLKNHAANIGANVTDGCGEFMPSGDHGTLEALKCAACSCHRNFHRREPSPSMSWVQPVKMAFRAGTDSSSEELNFSAYHSNAVVKKRFRTKFTREQKDKMVELAEKVGWRIPGEDDAEVRRFCAQVGVKRQVFKVWMHNNKTCSMKNPQQVDYIYLFLY